MRIQITAEFSLEHDEITAVSLKLRNGKSARTVQIEEGVLLADYDEAGQLLGLEILEPCDPERVAQLLNANTSLIERTVPAEMLVRAA
jgi:hypothetical protein